MRSLTLEVVTPRGGFLRETGVDEVVVRRRELRFDPGSEVAILPSHGPMIVRLADTEMRYRKAGRVMRIHAHGGFAEVRANVVTVMTPKAERPAPSGTGR